MRQIIKVLVIALALIAIPVHRVLELKYQSGKNERYYGIQVKADHDQVYFNTMTFG